MVRPVTSVVIDKVARHSKSVRHPCLRKYRPCVDEDGRVRIEGRLSKSPDVAVEAKHLLVITSKHPLTRLVAMFYHTRDQHCGAQHTLLLTRQRFWITNGSNLRRSQTIRLLTPQSNDICTTARYVRLKGKTR